MKFLRKVLEPDLYHGFGRKPPFFEGWYYKLISKDERHRFAIIPGMILGKRDHAFIQLLNGSSRESDYRVFPTGSFSASQEMFQVRIADNVFTRDRIILNLDDQDGLVQGELTFSGISPWPVTIRSPGIMGWYAWVPKMETYHGVVSLNHEINGILRINENELDFSGGLGYIEKDWGAAFPDAYVWYQSNHFNHADTSLTASVAIIPWVRSAFRGFICGLWHRGHLYRFATYTGAVIEKLHIFEDRIDWVLRDKKYRLEMKALRPEGGTLLGPDRAEMGKRIVETMSSTVEIRLSTLKGEEILSDTGRNTALEANGDLDHLINLK
jgi:hypothetical protein